MTIVYLRPHCYPLLLVANSQADATIVTEPWASVEDVAVHLGVAKESVYRWIDAKGMPAHKIGKLWKFKLSEVDDWVRRGGATEQPVGRPVAARRGKQEKQQ